MHTDIPDITYINNTFIRCKTSSAPAVVCCIYSICNFFHCQVTLSDLMGDRSINSDKMVSLGEIATALQSLKLAANGFQIHSLEGLDEIHNPSIILIHTEKGHPDFAVYYGRLGNKYLVGDPTWGLNTYHPFELDTIWGNRILLEVSRAKTEYTKKYADNQQ